MAARPSFSLDPTNAATVARICARLDGIAAGDRAGRRPRPAPAARRDPQPGSSASSSCSPRRPATSPSASGRSAGRSPGATTCSAEPHQHLLERLACFIGGCDLETAERVCGPADELGVDVFDGIAELADQSLVRRSEAGDDIRFTIPETIRQFAYERLQARGETDEIRRRHAEAFLDLARAAAAELSGADQRRWVERLEREHDNLRAALAWAIEAPAPQVALGLAFSLWRFWQKRGHLIEARRRLEEIGAKPWAQEEPVAYARFLEALGGIAYWQGDFVGAVRPYRAALDVWRELGDRAEIANALYNLAFTYNIDANSQSEPVRLRPEPGAGAARREPGDLPRDRRRPRDRQRALGDGQRRHVRRPLRRGAARLRRGPRGVPIGRRQDDGGLGAPHGRGGRRAARRLPRRPTTPSATPTATSPTPATSPASRSSSRTSPAWPSRRATRSAGSACGRRRVGSSRRSGPGWSRPRSTPVGGTPGATPHRPTRHPSGEPSSRPRVAGGRSRRPWPMPSTASCPRADEDAGRRSRGHRTERRRRSNRSFCSTTSTRPTRRR